MRSQYQIPPTPRVISPSPTPSEIGGKDGYFPPTTRAKGQKMNSRGSSVEPIEEQQDDHLHEEDPELARARARSRSPQISRPQARTNGGVTASGLKAIVATGPTRRKKQEDVKAPNGQPNGFLSPDSAYPRGFGSAYWRNLSRSPSPLGLIPIHREWREFIHKHEVPRKILHVSIGFVTLGLYWQGLRQDQIHPVLLSFLIPIFVVDVIRFRWGAFNKFYIRVLGPFMREAEAHDRYNGVIGYLAGLWVTMRFCRKDVSVVSVLLLSWCDTAASTFGRLWGKYTPRVRRGKSLAGSIAAFLVGAVTAAMFWGVIAPAVEGTRNLGGTNFMYQGTLILPAVVREQLGLSMKQATLSGGAALAVMSAIAGLVASVSEAIDLFGLDDNLTIPALCGIGLSAILWVFGSD
ncbi:Diacylglycerol kinase [Vermiconidia calcicola]|uniref:Diacylglycerol kinase n=1 Tax=Vermiconidia calcicola TaxID=1690605 RepID=A0ACC3NS45_9PEZI|nr:Diacylglycerol kinase [Vermiconidia calcicola]